MIRRFIAPLRELIRDVVFPDHVFCSCCGKILDREISSGLCYQCSGQLVKRLLPANRRETRLKAGPVISVFPYAEPVRQLILDLKHRGDAAAAEPLIRLAADVIREVGFPGTDTIVTWVSMPPDRLSERMIDHGRILAEGLAEELGLPCRQILIRAPGGHTQQGLNRKQRKQNVRGRFSVDPALLEEKKKRPCVLLIDDVLTTGSTLGECLHVLHSAGFRQVRAFTLCKD